MQEMLIHEGVAQQVLGEGVDALSLVDKLDELQ
jgi:hypothetical protein